MVVYILFVLFIDQLLLFIIDEAQKTIRQVIEMFESMIEDGGTGEVKVTVKDCKCVEIIC